MGAKVFEHFDFFVVRKEPINLIYLLIDLICRDWVRADILEDI